ncbi:MAG: putative colanic acid biosynthesis acetyltransferase [Akkermansiaceae bacterium]|nr:putative colanic acid biosynthesis acetyltransferase [Akkermansiaceae bacterium]
MSDIPSYQTHFPLKNKLARLAWQVVYALLFRPCIPHFLNGWRIFLLRCFGAKIGKGSVVYAQSRIWAPWNLAIGHKTCIGPGAELYNPAPFTIGNNVTISQKSYLCGGSHDISRLNKPFLCAPITIDDHVWICAASFIKMGIHLHKGCIVGATSSVFKDVEEWTVVGGNPARYLKDRVLRQD